MIRREKNTWRKWNKQSQHRSLSSSVYLLIKLSITTFLSISSATSLKNVYKCWRAQITFNIETTIAELQGVVAGLVSAVKDFTTNVNHVTQTVSEIAQVVPATHNQLRYIGILGNMVWSGLIYQYGESSFFASVYNVHAYTFI